MATRVPTFADWESFGMRKFMGAVVVVAFAIAGLMATSASGGEPTSPQGFMPTGAAQEFTVPADVCDVTITALGAAGGELEGQTLGGEGGAATAVVPVTAGEVLQVNVGGAGSSPSSSSGGAAGFNGGGAGGAGLGPAAGGAGGGGASDVRQGGTASVNRVVVAGGGAGAGNRVDSVGGPGGGPTGGNGGGPLPGGGATASAVGTSGGSGAPGSGDSGGSGGDSTITGGGGGGGGGGGLFGGGGGGGQASGRVASGGGGGSGFTPDGTGLTQGGNTGDGDVTISWTVDPGCADTPTTTTTPSTPDEVGSIVVGPVAARPAFTG